LSRFQMQPHQMLSGVPLSTKVKVTDGQQGNVDTIQLMKAVANSYRDNPLVRDLALNIVHCAGVQDHKFVTEAAALGDYVQKNVRYSRDPYGTEMLQDPLFLIQRITEGRARGDCDDQALLFSTLALAIGLDPYFRAIKYRSFWGPYDHIYSVVYDRDIGSPEERLVVDTITNKPIGYEVRHRYGEEYRVY
jgi:hypothetical protein